MMVDIDTCRTSATAIMDELQMNYPNTDPKVLNALKDLMIKYMVPVIQAARASSASKRNTSTKEKSEKGSSRPNYYAFFHAVCSPKGRVYDWIFYDYVFKYQPDPSKLKDKQLEIYEMLQQPEHDDKLKMVQEFESKGNINCVIQFVEKELDVTQMTRTSLIWYQFMSQHDRDRFSTWYNEIIKDKGEVPTININMPVITTPENKIPARIRIKQMPEPEHHVNEGAIESEHEHEHEHEHESESESEHQVIEPQSEPHVNGHKLNKLVIKRRAPTK